MEFSLRNTPDSRPGVEEPAAIPSGCAVPCVPTQQAAADGSETDATEDSQPPRVKRYVFVGCMHAQPDGVIVWPGRVAALLGGRSLGYCEPLSCLEADALEPLGGC